VIPDAEADEAPEEDCDPAGITVHPSSLAWQKIAAGTPEVEFLAGSHWKLTPVGSDNSPTGESIEVIDCEKDSADDCEGADSDPAAGKFLVTPLTDGRYELIETRAPSGYQLDPTPRYIEVVGSTAFGVPIENKQAEVPGLPLTGGLGASTIFMGSGILGALMLLGLLIQRRYQRS
jgi:hypothetical protein